MLTPYEAVCPVVSYTRRANETTFKSLSSALQTQFHLPPAALPDVEAWLKRVHPDDRDRVRVTYTANSPYRLTYRVDLPNGAVRWLLDTARVAEDGTVVGCWVDISDQKETESELRRQLHYFEQTVDGTKATVFIQDTDHRYVWVYNGIIAEEDALGKDDFEIVNEPLASRLYAIKQRVIDTETSISEEFVITRKGRQQYFESLFQPYYDEEGVLAGVRTLSVDVTELREAQQQLKQQARRLAQSNHDLERFAYAVSHDLQEPLRAITGYLDLLKSLYSDQLDEEALDFVNEAADGAERMGQLVRGLLDYSRIDRKNQPLQPTPAGEALGDALANLSVLLNETQANITSGNLPTVMADPIQLTLLFQNLINNALKFHADAPPKIDIDATETDDGWLFSVRDNGIGIDPRYHDRIFGIFQRLHTRDEIEGTGMGLALCRRIIERHRGRIWVESEVGNGATFKFVLPYANNP